MCIMHPSDMGLCLCSCFEPISSLRTAADGLVVALQDLPLGGMAGV